MSDSNYLSFLEKASADHSAGTGTQAQSQSQGQSQTKTLDSDAQVPALLQSIDEFYVSETDEPFEPVVLRWEGGVLPDSGIFHFLSLHCQAKCRDGEDANINNR